MTETSFTHPGRLFLDGNTLPAGRAEIERVFRDYAKFLREVTRLPLTGKCDLSAILQRFNIQHKETSLTKDQDGFLLPDRGMIVTNSDQIQGRQRFSVAHELMEFLVHAFTTTHNVDQISTMLSESTSTDNSWKERLCDVGAAELLMPEASCIEFLENLSGPLSMTAAQEFASSLSTSLLATLTRCIRLSNEPMIVVVWAMAHKPSESASVNPEQLSLDEALMARPMKKLRVRSSFSNQGTHVFPKHKSVDEESLVLKSFDSLEYVQGNEVVHRGDCLHYVDVEACTSVADGGERYCYGLYRLLDDHD